MSAVHSMKTLKPALLLSLTIVVAACEARPEFVVIGDSIAEGHPALHGQLHHGGAPQPGQLAYELSPAAPAANMGIGGQTTDEVRKRWRRDTAGARLVYLHAGINDLAQGRTNTRRNLSWMAENAHSRGIKLWVANLGPDAGAWMTPAKEAEARDINAWLVTDFKREFPDVVVVDYARWATEGTGDFNHLRRAAFADEVHPNKAGYALYAKEVLRETGVVSFPLRR